MNDARTSARALVFAGLSLLCADTRAARSSQEQDAPRSRRVVRVVDSNGRPVQNARVVLLSRPLAELGHDWGLDRVEATTDERGRCSVRLRIGRTYRTWAWSRIDARHYRSTPVVEIGGRRQFSLRLHNEVSTLVKVFVPKVLRGSIKEARLIEAQTLTKARRIDIAADGSILLPPVPGSACTIDLCDERGCIRDSHEVLVRGPGSKATLRPARARSLELMVRVRGNRGETLGDARVFMAGRAQSRLLGTSNANGLALIALDPKWAQSAWSEDALRIERSGYRSHSFSMTAAGRRRVRAGAVPAPRPVAMPGQRPRVGPPLRGANERRARLWLRDNVDMTAFMWPTKPVSGRVLIDKETPAVGLLVIARSDDHDMAWLTSIATTDEGGRYVLENGGGMVSCCLDPSLTLRLDGFGRAHWHVWLGTTSPRRNRAPQEPTFRLDRLHKLRLQLTKADGEPAAHARALVSLRNPELNTRLVCDLRGRATVLTGLTGLKQVASVTHDGHSLLHRERIKGNALLKLSMRPPRRLGGLVLNAAGEAAAHAQVMLRFDGSSFDALRELQLTLLIPTDENGRFALPIRYGKAALRATLRTATGTERSMWTLVKRNARGHEYTLQTRR